MASFGAVTFRDLVDDDGFGSDWEQDANIDEQPTGESVNFDVGNPPAAQLSVSIECSAAQLSALMLLIGQRAALTVSGESPRSALLKSVRGTKKHAIHDKRRATLTFLGA